MSEFYLRRDSLDDRLKISPSPSGSILSDLRLSRFIYLSLSPGLSNSRLEDENLWRGVSMLLFLMEFHFLLCLFLAFKFYFLSSSCIYCTSSGVNFFFLHLLHRLCHLSTFPLNWQGITSKILTTRQSPTSPIAPQPISLACSKMSSSKYRMPMMVDIMRIITSLNSSKHCILLSLIGLDRLSQISINSELVMSSTTYKRGSLSPKMRRRMKKSRRKMKIV